MSEATPTPQKPTFGQRAGRVFKRILLFLARFVLTLLILGAIAAAIYYGAPVLKNEYFMKDVDANSARIHELSTKVEQNNEFFAQRFEALQTRLEVLESERDANQETIVDLQNQLAEAETQLQDQESSLEQLSEIQTTLDELNTAITSLETLLGDHETSLANIESEIDDLSLEIESNQEELQALDVGTGSSDTIRALRQELDLVKAMELVTRARVNIGQDNIGLAEDDLMDAQELLTNLSANLPTNQSDYVLDIVERLDSATENLLESPNLANQDLEVAWQLLLAGLPLTEAVIPTGTPTPTPTGTLDTTPTATPTPTQTP